MDKKLVALVARTYNISQEEVAKRATKMAASIVERTERMPEYLRPYLDQFGLLGFVPKEIFIQSQKTTSRPELGRPDSLVFLVREEKA